GHAAAVHAVVHHPVRVIGLERIAATQVALGMVLVVAGDDAAVRIAKLDDSARFHPSKVADYLLQGRSSTTSPQLGIGGWSGASIQRNWPFTSLWRIRSSRSAAFSGGSPPVSATQATHWRRPSPSAPSASAWSRMSAHMSVFT